MVGHGGSCAGSYLPDPTSPIPSHCASIVVTSTLRVNLNVFHEFLFYVCSRRDIYNKDSYKILTEAGIDFDELQTKGIRPCDFADQFCASGLVLNENVTWVTFQG